MELQLEINVTASVIFSHLSVLKKLCLVMKAPSENTVYLLFCRDGIFVMLNPFFTRTLSRQDIPCLG